MKKTLMAVLAVVLAAMTLAVNASAYVLLDNCDAFTVNEAHTWGGTYAEYVEDADAPEGSGYIKGTAANGLMILSMGWDDIDLSEMTDGYFHINVYVDDAASVTSGQMELTSSNKADVDENSWEVPDLALVDGWNELSLKIADANIVNGGLDFAGLNTFRIYMYTGNPDNYICVDNLGVGTEDEITLVLDACDAIGEDTGFTGNSWGAKMARTIAEDGEDAAAEGEGSIAQIDKSTLILTFVATDPYDISEFIEDGYLMFDLYLSDGYGTSLGGQIELTSSGNSDVEEVSWSMAELSYIGDGWNKVCLPFTTASTWMEDFDPTAVDFFRIYDFVVTGEDVEMRVDNINVGSEADAIELGFMEAAAEEEIEETEEAVEEAVESVEEEVEEAVESVEEEVEEAVESAVEGAENAAAAAAEEATGLSTGAIAGIAAGGVVVIAAIIAAIVAASKKKKK